MKSTLIAALALATVTGAGMMMVAAGPDGGGLNGASIAGTYVSVFEYDGATLMATVQFNADGTVLCSHQTDFGVIGFVTAPAYGSWAWSGPGKIEGTMLALCFQPDGTPIGTLQLRFATKFEDGLQTAHGQVKERFYRVGQDPLDPLQGEPFGPEVVSPTLRRLSAQ